MKSVLAALTLCLLTSGVAQAGSFTFTPSLASVPGTSYVVGGQAFHFVDPAFGVDENIIPTDKGISLDQIASTSDLNSAVAGLNATIASINGSVGGFGSSIAGLQSQLLTLRSQTFTGVALAAALTPILPVDGKTNHLNFAATTAFDRAAWSVNYAHVEGDFDFIAGAAFTEKYGLGKVGVGYSW